MTRAKEVYLAASLQVEREIEREMDRTEDAAQADRITREEARLRFGQLETARAALQTAKAKIGGLS